MKTFLKIWVGISLMAMGFGVALLVIAFASGAQWDDAAVFTSMNENYDEVVRLDIDIKYGEVKIVEGNEFAVSADNILEGEMKSYVEDGTWYIREEDSSDSNIFGIDFPVRQMICWGDHFTPDITITIPEGFIAENFILKVGAGTLIADDVNTTEGVFSVGAGRIEIDQLTSSEKSKFKVGTGEMVLKNVTVNDVTVDCGIGNLDVDGVITGDSDVKCGIGEVDLDLKGDENDYSYDVRSGIGKININGKSYHSTKNVDIGNEDADNSLYLDCGIGNISVEFK